eukprot:10976379-Lingulodinium_polyedra.AAC.1
MAFVARPSRSRWVSGDNEPIMMKALHQDKAYEGWRKTLAGLQVPSNHLRLGRATSLTGELSASVEADEL